MLSSSYLQNLVEAGPTSRCTFVNKLHLCEPCFSRFVCLRFFCQPFWRRAVFRNWRFAIGQFDISPEKGHRDSPKDGSAQSLPNRFSPLLVVLRFREADVLVFLFFPSSVLFISEFF